MAETSCCGVPPIREPDGQEWCPECGCAATLGRARSLPTGNTMVKRVNDRYVLVGEDGTEVEIGSYPEP